MMDASENNSKRLNAKKGDISQTRRIYFSNRRWTNQTSWRRSGTENIHLDTRPPNSRRRSQRFLENQKGLHHYFKTHFRMPVKREMIFGPCQETFIYRHHVEPRVKLYSPREESFPIPLKYIDVSRTTHTNLDVKQEKRIDDYWNIDGSRDMSDPWTGFTQFTLLEEKPPNGYMWSGWRLTRKQLTSRPDHLWPELWKSMGKHAKLKEKQKWSNEKPKLDNAGRLRGIHFIDSETRNSKKPLRMFARNWKTPVAPAMPCKNIKNNENCGSGVSKKIKTKLAYSGEDWQEMLS